MTTENKDVQPAQSETQAATDNDDFFSDAPMACPMRKPGDTDEICEACQ